MVELERDVYWPYHVLVEALGLGGPSRCGQQCLHLRASALQLQVVVSYCTYARLQRNSRPQRRKFLFRSRGWSEGAMVVP